MIDPHQHIVDLIKQYALEVKPEGEYFTLSSGKQSRYYFDLRKLLFSPVPLGIIVEALWHEIVSLTKVWQFNKFGGPSVGADPLVCGLTFMLRDWPVMCESFLVRKNAKVYGTGGQIVGNVQPSDSCLLIDDVATTGESILNTAQAVWEAGATVCGAITVLDRLEGAGEMLAAHKVNLVSLVTINDFKEQI